MHWWHDHRRAGVLCGLTYENFCVLVGTGGTIIAAPLCTARRMPIQSAWYGGQSRILMRHRLDGMMLPWSTGLKRCMRMCMSLCIHVYTCLSVPKSTHTHARTHAHKRTQTHTRTQGLITIHYAKRPWGFEELNLHAVKMRFKGKPSVEWTRTQAFANLLKARFNSESDQVCQVWATHTYTHAHMHMHTCACTHAHAHTHMHTHMHTRTCTHAHAHVLKAGRN